MSEKNSDDIFNNLFSAESSSVIGSITKARSNPLLLDNISNWYIFEDECRMSFSVLRKYEQLIRANCVEVDFEREWLYRPEYCSYDCYGTTDLWYLIMFVNNIDYVNNFNFIGHSILVPTQDFINVFKSIITKETRMLKTLDEPIRIYKHILKSLDSPSKQVLPSNFDDEMDGLSHLKEYIDISDKYLHEGNFQSYTDGIICGVLRTEFFEIDNGRQFKYKDDTYDARFDKVDNYIDLLYNTPYRMIRDDDNEIMIHKTGNIRVHHTGTYKFKIVSIGKFYMIIDEKHILNYDRDLHGLDTHYVKNVIEEYSNNADFKRRNLDFYNVYTEPDSSGTQVRDILVNQNVRNLSDLYNSWEQNENKNSCSYESWINLIYDSNHNKTMLCVRPHKKRYNGRSTVLKVLEMKVPINGIESDIKSEAIHNLDKAADDKIITFENSGDIFYKVDYYLPEGRSDYGLGLQLDFINSNNQVVKTLYKNHSNDNFNLNNTIKYSETLLEESHIDSNITYSYIKISLFLEPTFNLRDESESINIGDSFNDFYHPPIYIDKLSLFRLDNTAYTTELTVDLDCNKSYSFESYYYKGSYNDSFNGFNLLYKIIDSPDKNSPSLSDPNDQWNPLSFNDYIKVPFTWFSVNSKSYNGYKSFDDSCNENQSILLNKVFNIHKVKDNVNKLRDKFMNEVVKPNYQGIINKNSNALRKFNIDSYTFLFKNNTELVKDYIKWRIYCSRFNLDNSVNKNSLKNNNYYNIGNLNTSCIDTNELFHMGRNIRLRLYLDDSNMLVKEYFPPNLLINNYKYGPKDLFGIRSLRKDNGTNMYCRINFEIPVIYHNGKIMSPYDITQTIERILVKKVSNGASVFIYLNYSDNTNYNNSVNSNIIECLNKLDGSFYTSNSDINKLKNLVSRYYNQTIPTSLHGFNKSVKLGGYTIFLGDFINIKINDSDLVGLQNNSFCTLSIDLMPMWEGTYKDFTNFEIYTTSNPNLTGDMNTVLASDDVIPLWDPDYVNLSYGMEKWFDKKYLDLYAYKKLYELEAIFSNTLMGTNITIEETGNKILSKAKELNINEDDLNFNPEISSIFFNINTNIGSLINDYESYSKIFYLNPEWIKYLSLRTILSHPFLPEGTPYYIGGLYRSEVFNEYLLNYILSVIEDTAYNNENSNILMNTLLTSNILSDNTNIFRFIYESYINRDKVKEFIKTIVLSNSFNSGSVHRGAFKMHLKSPLKNTLYKYIADTELEDDYIIRFTLKYDNEKHHESNRLVLSSTHSGLFGWILDYGYNDDIKNSYLVLYNLFEDGFYLESGVYKFNKLSPDKFYNATGNYHRSTNGYLTVVDNQFKDNFTKLASLDPNFLMNDVFKEGGYKIITIQNLYGWIVMRNSNDKDSFLKINDKRIVPKNNAYYGGRLGLFFLGIDGLRMDITLYN